MTYVQNPQPPEVQPLWRWLLFPVVAALFFSGLYLLPQIINAMGVDTSMMMNVLMPTVFAFPAGVLVLSIWWFCFSGIRWGVRLGLPMVVMSAGSVAMILSIRSFELSSQEVGLRPIFHFTWNPSAEDKLSEHLQTTAAKATKLPPIDATVGADDFASYRGAAFDGVIANFQIATDWTKSPPRELWRAPCPGGYGGIAVAGNIAITLQQRGDNEVVVCYDRATGVQRWEFAYDAFWKDVMGNGPRSTPTIHDGRVYTTGATGMLVCLDVHGNKLWSINILEDNRATNIKWGMTGSPLIVDDVVIVNSGVDPSNNAGMALTAYDQTTGKKKWALSHHLAGYSSPRLATLDGVKQILMFHGDALVGHDLKTGVELWTIPWVTPWEMNSIQPVVVGNDQVFISSEASVGCALFRINRGKNDRWETTKVWSHNKIGARFANPVTDGKDLYCLHHTMGLLMCLDVKDGAIKWKGPRLGPGQLLLVGDTLLATNGDDGSLNLFATNTGECKELATLPLLREKTWNTPALAGDQLFVRNQYEIVCLKLSKR